MKRFIICIFFLSVILTVNADVLGPYTITYNQSTPSGYAKIVVYSVPNYSGGGISLTKEGSTINLCASSVYIPIWYYFVPTGIYTINKISSNFKTMINGEQVFIGSTVNFTSNGYIEFQAL